MIVCKPVKNGKQMHGGGKGNMSKNKVIKNLTIVNITLLVCVYWILFFFGALLTQYYETMEGFNISFRQMLEARKVIAEQNRDILTVLEDISVPEFDSI